MQMGSACSAVVPGNEVLLPGKASFEMRDVLVLRFMENFFAVPVRPVPTATAATFWSGEGASNQYFWCRDPLDAHAPRSPSFPTDRSKTKGGQERALAGRIAPLRPQKTWDSPAMSMVYTEATFQSCRSANCAPAAAPAIWPKPLAATFFPSSVSPGASSASSSWTWSEKGRH